MSLPRPSCQPIMVRHRRTQELSRWPLDLTVSSQLFFYVSIDLRRLVADAGLGEDVDEVVLSFPQLTAVRGIDGARRSHGTATLRAPDPP